MRKRQTLYLVCGIATACVFAGGEAAAGVERQASNSANEIIFVSDDPWQPEGFVNGTAVPAAWIDSPAVDIDGDPGDEAWKLAKEVEVPLQFGTVDRAWVKAVYTDEEVFIQVRWPDSTEDRAHHPWVWDAKKKAYVEGAQVEDSVMLSFEAGCEWTPSLLGGYVYDFDGWHWMAARTDPLGQAVDLYGNVQDREMSDENFRPYSSRVKEKDWILKFTENHDVGLHADWDQVDRVYMMMPVTNKLWVRAVPDGGRQAPEFVESLPAPEPTAGDPARVVPQFSPVKLTGGAAEVAAKGQWQDGYWTVEFRRMRHTPAEHIYDTIFNRMVQFSIQVFDRVERLDEASESGRLFLRFLPPEQSLASN